MLQIIDNRIKASNLPVTISAIPVKTVFTGNVAGRANSVYLRIITGVVDLCDGSWFSTSNHIVHNYYKVSAKLFIEENGD